MIPSGPQPLSETLRDAALSWPVWVLHLGALATPLLVAPTWMRVGQVGLTYVVLMVCVTAGYHRYFSHRAFKTSRAGQFLLAWAAQTWLQKGVIWWAATHRLHHVHSDTDLDPHSPVQRGWWWGHIGWTLSAQSNTRDDSMVQDWLAVPELVWLDRFWWLPPAVLLGALGLIGGWPMMLWGYLVPVVLGWHGSYSINSLGHLWGTQRFVGRDQSRNSMLAALITMGEGWHNNHHRNPAAARQGLIWWEVDVTWYVLRLFAAVGLIWDLRVARPEKRLSASPPSSPRCKSEQAEHERHGA